MKNLIILLPLLALLANCASVSTLQTARVLKEDDSTHSIGLGTYSSDDFVGGGSISMPVIEYTYRRGMWKDIDLGVKLAIIGSTVVDLKYNLINGEKFALATGVGLGYLSFTSTVGAQEQKSTILDLMVPLYLSYDINKTFSVYGAGKYMLRTISSDVAMSGDGSLVSSSLGVKWGQSSGVFLEGSLIAGLDNSFSGTQFNTSYFFKF